MLLRKRSSINFGLNPSALTDADKEEKKQYIKELKKIKDLMFDLSSFECESSYFNGNNREISAYKNENIKIIGKTQKFNNIEELKKCINEYLISKNLHHENIVSCIGYRYNLEIKEFTIFTEYVEGKCLSDFDINKTDCSYDIIKLITQQLLNALKYLHDQNIIHFDIKLQNIIISSQVHITILDFGESSYIKDYNCNRMYGTKLCMSPEIRTPDKLKNNKLIKLCDVWSLGISLSILFNNEINNIIYPLLTNILFDKYDHIIEIIIQELSECTITGINPEQQNLFIDFIKMCLQINMENRWYTDDLLCHPFIIQD